MTRTTTPTPAEDATAAFDACRQLSLTGLAPELDVRHERRRARRVQEARLPRVKTLNDFDLTANPMISPHIIGLLRSGTFIDASEPVVLLGNSGTGKSHLLIGACLAAAETGRRVRYASPAPNSPTNSAKPKTTTTSPASWPATHDSTSSPSTNSATSASTPAPPSSSSK